MKKWVKHICLLVIVAICFAGLSGFALGMENAPTRVINVVYDDSGSMYMTDDGNQVDTWCQAKYAVEVFAAMLGDTDTLNVYYMSDYQWGTDNGPRLVLKGADGAATNVAKIHSEKTCASTTPFNSVKKAYSDLTAVTADEKWLVILTDGAFEDGAVSKSEVDSYLEAKTSDIQVMFLAIGSGAMGITENESQNIYFTEAKTSSDILKQLTGICNRIFNSNRLDVNVSSKKFSFDVPMGELIVFAQGANVEINGITDSNGKLIKSSKNPVGVMYSECDAINNNNLPATDLVGSIATFTDDFNAGDYSVDVTGAETIEIFYKPNIQVAAYLSDKDGNEVTDMVNLAAGEYTIHFCFVKTGTNEIVSQSELLGEVTYEAQVTNDGITHEKLYNDGDIIEIKEGPLTIDVTARYLDYNSVYTKLDYSVFKDKEITFSIINDPTFLISSKGIDNTSCIQVKAQIDGADVTEEQWEIMDVPVISLKDEKRKFGMDNPLIKKGSEKGIYLIYPQLPDGHPTTGTYDECNYDLTYKQIIDSETWSGQMEGKLKMNDTRSWLERNRDYIFKLVILLLIVLLLLGYVPGIKHYLPKSLKKNPYIKCIPSAPGEKRKDRSGSVDKSFASTILPYVPQKGTIRYVPKGVTGAPALAVKGLKERRMAITNVKALAGKDYITFDGNVIDKEKRTYPTGAAVTIRVKRGEWTYICNPNQSN